MDGMIVHEIKKEIERYLPGKNRILALLLCGLLGISSLTMAAPGALRITIGTFAPYYSPKIVRIEPGTSIVWNNPTGALHSITHDACQSGGPCAFDSGPLGPHGSFSIEHLPPGSYPYHCSFHPIMRGILIIQVAEHPTKT